MEKQWDKTLLKMGEIQTNLSEQIEQAKMSRGFGGGVRKADDENPKPAKVDEADITKKLKELDLNTLLGIDKFRDSVNFDIRMLKDE